jgi:hypothetical protein
MKNVGTAQLLELGEHFAKGDLAWLEKYANRKAS